MNILYYAMKILKSLVVYICSCTLSLSRTLCYEKGEVYACCMPTLGCREAIEMATGRFGSGFLRSKSDPLCFGLGPDIEKEYPNPISRVF